MKINNEGKKLLVVHMTLNKIAERHLYYKMFQRPEDLWAIHSQPVFPRPHKKDSSSWMAIQKVLA